MLVFTLILRGYFAISILTFAYFFREFWRDRSTAKTDCSSWQVLGLVSILWPVVLPVSYWERQVNASASKPHIYEVKVYPIRDTRSLSECRNWESQQMS
jgi:hypothetical protein